jgi:hypothetical protein
MNGLQAAVSILETSTTTQDDALSMFLPPYLLEFTCCVDFKASRVMASSLFDFLLRLLRYSDL